MFATPQLQDVIGTAFTHGCIPSGTSTGHCPKGFSTTGSLDVRSLKKRAWLYGKEELSTFRSKRSFCQAIEGIAGYARLRSAHFAESKPTPDTLDTT